LIYKVNKDLCYIDITNILYAEYFSSLFPKSKFILLIRDGRATVTSINNNNVNYIGFKKTDFKENMINWNDLTEATISNCMKIGPEHCLPVFFEQLIIKPEQEIIRISNFLNYSLNKKQNQIMEKKNFDRLIDHSLNSWIEKIPDNLMKELEQVAPSLRKLGYDSYSKISNYDEIYEKLNSNYGNFQKNRQDWIDLTKNDSKLAYFKVLAKYF
jgi:protein-tyrosine sulfotransferase